MNIGRRVIFLAAGLAALAIALAGCGSKVVARVNGEKITRDEYYKRLEQVAVPVPVGGGGVAQQEAGLLALNELISERVINQLAEKEGVKPTERQINYKWNLLKKSGNLKRLMQSGTTEDEMRKRIATQQAFINVATKGIKVSDKEVNGFYHNNPNEFRQPKRVQVRLIITGSKKRIEEAKKSLDRGVDFQTVARGKCDDPGMRQSGGLALKPLTRGMKDVPPVVMKAAFSLSKGQYSKPFKVANTWVILKVEDILKAIEQELPDIKEYIRENLALAQARQKPDFVKRFVNFDKKADVVVEVERYKGAIKNLREMARPELPKTATPSAGPTGGAAGG